MLLHLIWRVDNSHILLNSHKIFADFLCELSGFHCTCTHGTYSKSNSFFICWITFQFQEFQSAVVLEKMKTEIEWFTSVKCLVLCKSCHEISIITWIWSLYDFHIIMLSVAWNVIHYLKKKGQTTCIYVIYIMITEMSISRSCVPMGTKFPSTGADVLIKD